MTESKITIRLDEDSDMVEIRVGAQRMIIRRSTAAFLGERLIRET